MSNKTYILTPPGRMVQGHPLEEQTKDHKGNPLIVKQGPNIGQPRVAFYLGVAVAKNDPAWPVFKGQIDAVGQAAFPGGESSRPDFAWKIIDGDLPEHVAKIGFPGHWVIRCSGGFMPEVYTAGGAVRVVDAKQLKRGDYVRVYLTVRGNGTEPPQSGIYLNPLMVEIVGYGEEIKTGPSGDEVFGGANAAQLPVGASATPVAPGAPIQPAALAPPVQPAALAPPVQPAALAPPVQPAAVAPPVQPAALAPPVQPAAVAPPVQPAALAPPVQPAAVAPPVQPAAVAPPVQPAAVAPPVQPAAVAPPVQPAPDFLNPDDKKYNLNGKVHTAGELKAANWTEDQIATLAPA